MEKARWPCLIQTLLVHVQFSGPRAMQTEPRAWEAARFKESPGLFRARLGSQEPRRVARACQVIDPKWRFCPQVSWRNF